MKVLILAYTQMNLGDDLFLHILLNRYPEIDFSLHCTDEFSKPFQNFKNLHIFNTPIQEYLKKHSFDGVVYIAGSVFMEPHNYNGKNNPNFKKWEKIALDCKKSKKPFFYISCNFGPYTHENYLKQTEKYLNICKDVCFRDKYSYEVFKKISGVRYAPDAALSAKYPKTKKIKDSVGISIIEPSIRWYIPQNKKEDYYNFLKTNIMYLINEGKEIFLFSFCESEGDVIAQKKLLDIIPKKYHEKINLLNYEGNVDSYLKSYNEMEYALCGRFHSIILSIIFNHKFFVTSYSNKTTNVINDFSIKNQIVKYETINPTEIIPINLYKKINPIKKIFIQFKSRNQFKAFDKWISSNN